MNTVEATESHPVYKKVRQEGDGVTPVFMVVVDEGWRQSILCEGMYGWAADFLVRQLQRIPLPTDRGRGDVGAV